MKLNKLKRGYKREDGMVFIAYRKKCKNGEHWVSEIKYEEMKLKDCEYHAKWLLKNREANKVRCSKRYYLFHEKSKERQRNWDNENRIRQNYTRKKRRNMDSLYNLSCNIRTMIAEKFRQFNYTKKSKANLILGCSWDFLKSYIESKFIDDMNWQNRKLWHIDHIIPASSARSESELIRLNHYTNLQPLWAKDNLSKGAKIL